MKKIIVLIGIMVNLTLLNAQKSYNVSYNKSQDSYQFFENKLVQGKIEKVEHISRAHVLVDVCKISDGHITSNQLQRTAW